MPKKTTKKISAKNKNVFKIIGKIILIIFIIYAALVIFSLIYRGLKGKKLLSKKTETVINYIDEQEEDKEKEVENILEKAKRYYNCKYRYSFKYPENWTISDYTYESDRVYVYGDGVNISFEAVPNKQNLTMQEWVENEKDKFAGTLAEKRETQRKDANGILLYYQNPEGLVFYWMEKSNLLEMQYSGKNFARDNPQSYVVGSTLEINKDNSQCK